MTDTDVTFLHYYRSCHDLYLLFIPASLQTLGRVECAVASASAPPALRTHQPFHPYLNFLSAFWTPTIFLALSASFHLPTVALIFVRALNVDASCCANVK